jgi:peroxiredoxin
LFSDASGEASAAFGIAFRVDDKTAELYKGFGIDLEDASGRDHHILPVPSIFIVDTEGTIRFVHYDANYRVRPDPHKVLEAAAAAR